MPRINNSYILRCIGQDLEVRGIKAFDLRSEGERYVVQCSYQNPPSPMPVTLHYTMDDIEQLDIAGQEKQGTGFPPGEFVTLVQILRAIGGYLDNNQALLLRISNNESAGQDPVFRVEYQTPEGDRVSEDRDGSAIYDLCVSMYKQRGKLSRRAKKYASWRR